MLGKSELGGMSASQRQGNDSTNGRLEWSEEGVAYNYMEFTTHPWSLSLQHSPTESDARTDKWILVYAYSLEASFNGVWENKFELHLSPFWISCVNTKDTSINMSPHFHKKLAICGPSTVLYIFRSTTHIFFTWH